MKNDTDKNDRVDAIRLDDDPTIRDSKDAREQALVESLMSSQGLDESEARDRLENEDWRGMNSTEAAQEAEKEAEQLPPPHQTALSVPYGEDEGNLDTIPQPDVPPGVTPPQIVVDKPQGKLTAARDEVSSRKTSKK